MKNSHYTGSQILSILKQAEEGSPDAELCRKYGISNTSFYKWCSKYGGMDTISDGHTKRMEVNHY